MYAFWRYDQYPYILHGEVVGGPNDRGHVQIKGYATPRQDGTYGGGWFRPLWIISDTAGKDLAIQVDELRSEKQDAMKKLHKEFDDKLTELPSELRHKS